MLALDSPVTWRSVALIGLGFAGEYALLALIEDAPEALKVATMMCAVAAIFILGTENRFHRQHRYLFIASILAVTAIYMGFVVYAIKHEITKGQHLSRLEDIYSDVEKLIGGAIPNLEKPEMSDTAIDKLEFKSSAWERATAEWLDNNLGHGARARFFERSRMPTYCWDSKCSRRYASIMNRLLNEQNNISIIRESGIYRRPNN
jgi:hypothetical protein